MDRVGSYKRRNPERYTRGDIGLTKLEHSQLHYHLVNTQGDVGFVNLPNYFRTSAKKELHSDGSQKETLLVYSIGCSVELSQWRSAADGQLFIPRRVPVRLAASEDRNTWQVVRKALLSLRSRRPNRLF